MNTDLSSPRYSIPEDAQGLLVATAQAALGIHLLRAAGLMTVGTAGLALLIVYASGQSFGLVFFLVNLPFYALAWARKGRAFTVKSFVALTQQLKAWGVDHLRIVRIQDEVGTRPLHRVASSGAGLELAVFDDREIDTA